MSGGLKSPLSSALISPATQPTFPLTTGVPQVQLAAARFAGDAQFANTSAIALGGANPNGATNFEVQALVYIEGAGESQDRVFMVQFPAGRQAGLFCSNVTPANLHTGDSQVGSVGGYIGASPGTGKWCLLTFSADGTAGTSGFWDSSVESLDGTVAYSHGGRTKGVEVSLQGNRVDLNGGGVDFGWANGIRYAEFRAYNGAPRSQAQRSLDLRNTTNFNGALFWFRFANNGSGGVVATDMTGNGNTLTITGGTLAAGPLV